MCNKECIKSVTVVCTIWGNLNFMPYIYMTIFMLFTIQKEQLLL